MIVIPTERRLFTVVLAFDVDPDERADFIEELGRFVHDRMRRHEGFVSGIIYVSDDDRGVVEHFQWQTQDDYLAYRRSPEGRAAAAWLMDREPRVFHLELAAAVTPDGPIT